MDAHEREFFGAVEGMQDVYGVPLTPATTVTTGSRRIPVWNVGAVVGWRDAKGRDRRGNVIEIRLPEDNLGDIDADRRVYVIQTRDPVTLAREFVELTHEALCEF